MKDIKNVMISMVASPSLSAKCEAKATPSGDKPFCYGVNQDGTCTSAKADIPLEGGKFDCKECFVGVSADMYYKLNYTWTSLNSVEVGVRDAHLRGSAALHSHPSGSTTAVKGTKVLVDNSTRFTLIDKTVGCPVCVKVKITVAVPTSVDYEVTLKGEADVTAGAMVDINLGDHAIKWDHVTGWTHPQTEPSAAVKPILDIGTVRAEADVTLGVDTSFQLDVENVIWSHLDLKPSFPLKCTAKGGLWPIRKGQFCLSGDASLTISHEADLHWKLLGFKENHHWGPHQDYAWTRSGIVNVCKNVGIQNSSTMEGVVVI